ncbi:MAG: hypothetical protein KatS3mg082_3279 [Nitrospiraceae bacterium]|nr:MAG: hypothetical protein KatS3mg082_3279 [Nitrospiraceae bacterium]
MSDHPLNCWDWFAVLATECSEVVGDYDRDMGELERRRRSAQGQERRALDQEIRGRAQRICEQLLEGQICNESLLASGFIDKVALWVHQSWPRAEDARVLYMNRAQELSSANDGLRLPPELNLDPWPPELLHRSWLALEVEFELLTPWYSKDDRLFHVLDNPVRKDRVFGVPFMAAASWKGMLRWAFLVVTKLIGPDREKDETRRKQAKATELHLFGNEKGEEKKFHQGALVFYPTWFDKIGFEVINPHDRSRRAGTQPIYYEVVPGRRPKPDNPSEYAEGGKARLAPAVCAPGRG